MDEPEKLFDKYCNVMKQSTKGNEIGVYGIAFIGLGLALRRMRPFSKFKKPSDIPNYFIQKRRELIGVVERIEPNGALLMVNHKPLLYLPTASKDCLPVKLVNVKVTNFGISWMQAIVTGSEVKFTPISKSNNFVSCEVVLPQVKEKNKIKNIDVGESLVSIGFGTVDDSEESTRKYYIKKLEAAERSALRKKMGMMYYLQPTKNIFYNILYALKTVIDKIKQKQFKNKNIIAIK